MEKDRQTKLKNWIGMVALKTKIHLKVQAEKKKRLHITGYYQGKYLYTMMREGLIKYYKEYGVNKQKHAIS